MAASVAALAHGCNQLLPRHNVVPELALQQGLRELERAALVEVRVVRPVHPGHGQDVNTFRIIVFPVRQAPQKVERITDLYGGAAQPARLNRVEAALVAACPC